MKTTVLLLAFIFFAQFSYAQQTTVNELNFQNPALISGTAGANNAKYRFSNVTPGIDAIVTLVSRSSSAVTLSSIDNTGSGYAKNFQPQLGISGTVATNQNWWMEFSIAFVYSGGTTQPIVYAVNASSIDVDGDGGALSEWFTAYNASSMSLNTPTLLTMTSAATAVAGEYTYTVTGPTINKTDIDTASKDVVANYAFSNRNTVTIRLGSKTGNGTTTAGVRLNSIFFRSFTYKPLAQGASLPVKLTSFTASLQRTEVQLAWTIASEENFNFYELQRSEDGVNYRAIATVFGTGANQYSYADRSPSGRQVFYRLRMVDLDGSFTYSPVCRLALAEAGSIQLGLYPNPAVHDLNVQVPAAWQGKNLVITVYQVNGSQQLQKTTKAGSSVMIPVQGWAKGTYVLDVRCGNESARQLFQHQ